MQTWPILSTTPSLDGWKQGIANDPTLRSKSEGGYSNTRPRFTRIPKKWDFRYAGGNALTPNDKTMLETFQNLIKVGSEIFTWTNPMNNTVYNVRLAQPLVFSPQNNTLHWTTDVSLEEA